MHFAMLSLKSYHTKQSRATNSFTTTYLFEKICQCKVQGWTNLAKMELAPEGLLHRCHGDSQTVFFQILVLLYLPTVPDRLGSRQLRQDGRRRGWGVCLAEREQPEVGL